MAQVPLLEINGLLSCSRNKRDPIAILPEFSEDRLRDFSHRKRFLPVGLSPVRDLVLTLP